MTNAQPAMRLSEVLWLLRSLVIGALAIGTSVLSGIGLKMMGGGFALVLAVLLTAPAAAIQWKQISQRVETRWWATVTVGGAIVGAMVGSAIALMYGHGGTVHVAEWSLQSGVMGLSIGTFVGAAQSATMKSQVISRGRWVALSTVAYGSGSCVVDQPFHAPTWMLMSIAYLLTLGAVFMQGRISDGENGGRRVSK